MEERTALQHVDHIIEQLWQPALSGGALRVVTDPHPNPDWVDVETYWAVPGLSNLQMLIPKGDRRVTAGATSHYRGLRTRMKNLLRAAGGVSARMGVPLSRHTVAVQVHRDSRAAAATLLTSMLSTELGQPLHASIGVRTGDNRKATLALWTGNGQPAGYAKVGWNQITDAYVATEARLLQKFGGAAGPMRAPALLGTLDYYGHPVVVTQPLPLNARGGHVRGVAAPTSEEIYSLAPIHRCAAVADSAHLIDLSERLRRLAQDPTCAATAEPALALLRAVESNPHPLPITERWHGDLTPWNCARDASGQLWAWDWENSEADPVAGLDPLHWAYSVRRLRARHLDEVRLADCLADASAHLTAAGVRRESWPVVAAVYALTVVERACSLAAHHGSWDSVWIPLPTLAELTAEAQTLLGRRAR